VTCRFLEDIPALEETGRLAAKRTLDLMGGKKIKTEKLPVIIENRSVGRV
jgi:predicted Zn-dependent protease